MSDTARDPQTPQHTEPDLEQQVESLLADVSSAVEEINRKLSDEPAAETTPDVLDGSAVLSDEGEDESQPGSLAQSEPEPEAEPDPEPQADAAVLTAADVQAALEQAVDDAPASDADEPETDPSDAHEPEAEHAEDEPEAGNGYGDISSLDDELAALASSALDDDLGTIEEVIAEVSTPPITGSAAETTPEPPEETGIEPLVAPAKAGGPAPTKAAPAAAATGPTDSPPAEKPRPARQRPTAGPLRWGWLPPKPQWEEVYTRWRPLVIAWRHVLWIGPPLATFLGGLLWRHGHRAEPHVRHAVAVAATPLSRRDARTRSAIGYLAINTLFWSACLWVYILFARSPAIPEAAAPPTALQAQSAVTESAMADSAMTDRGRRP